ncbi:hypothetical protein [Paenibacillus sp. 453mf]|uniref:hypothetical protein n=1 Tax=Paenibacillus sp. 453mf TaxID=1761874 RepID=UPI0008F2877D|nr:hypothetical protein [Paenibacillus sp. 453mf]SFS62243.1 hypothetical protein SAMN04488601_1012862 [Paenibacillus sp. 453mf]
MIKKITASSIFALCLVYSLFRFQLYSSEGPLFNMEFIVITLIICSSVLYYFFLEFRDLWNVWDEEKLSNFKMGLILNFTFVLLLLFNIRDLKNELNPIPFDVDGRAVPIDWAAAKLNLLSILVFSILLVRSVVGLWFLKKLQQNDSLDVD